MNDFTVLIAEDDKILRQLMINILEAFGIVVVAAENGLAALSLIETHKIDLVISDRDMPLMSGVQLALQIKSNPQTKHISFVLASGVIREELESIPPGTIDAFLPKPFTVEQTLNLVTEFRDSAYRNGFQKAA